MSKLEEKQQNSLPPVRIQRVSSPTWCVMGAIEAGRAIAARVARPILGTRTGPRCMG